MPVAKEALSPHLQDIQDIIELKQDLSPEEIALAAKLRPQLKAMLKPEVRVELEVEYAKKLQEANATILKQSQEAVTAAIKEWKEDQQPLSQGDIQTLLSQDYLQFETNFQIRHMKEMKTVKFNLIELPQEIEDKFLKVLKTRFIPLMQDLAAAEFKMELDSSAVEKLQSLVEALPQVLNVLAHLVAICLDPFEDNDEYGAINEAWVKHNLATHRILAIIIGQMEVQRYRDFFLNGFRLSKSLQKTR